MNCSEIAQYSYEQSLIFKMPDRQQQTILQRWKFKVDLKEVWNTISIEPVFLLFALCQGFYIVIAKQLYLDKVKYNAQNM